MPSINFLSISSTLLPHHPAATQAGKPEACACGRVACCVGAHSLTALAQHKPHINGVYEKKHTSPHKTARMCAMLNKMGITLRSLSHTTLSPPFSVCRPPVMCAGGYRFSSSGMTGMAPF